MTPNRPERSLVERLRLLVVGIDRYLPLENGYLLYRPLMGAVKDAERVERFFRDQWGLKSHRIHKLIAPVGGGEAPEQTPTYEALVKAFRGLRDGAEPGDPVWIHYSGHGGRAATLWPELKGKDGSDEGLVPVDVSEKGGRYLRDLELATLLDELVDAGLAVTLVLDCCHSGGAVRRGRTDVPGRRGSGYVDRTVRPGSSLVATHETLSGNWRSQAHPGVLRVRDGTASGWLPEPRGYALIAACAANEMAIEDVYDGSGFSGALTHHLLQALADFPARERTCRELYKGLSARIRDVVPGQTPQLEGAGDRLLLGNGEASVRATLTVLKTDLEKRRVCLDAGRAHGLVTGNRVSIFGPGARDLATAQSVATAEVAVLDGASSWADVVHGELAALELGAPAVLLGRGGRCSGRKIRLPSSPPAPSETVAEMCRHLAREESLELLPPSTPESAVDFSVIAEGRRFLLRGRHGEELSPRLDPTPVDAPRAAWRLAVRLIHLARFHDVLELTPDPAGSAYGLRLDVDPARPRDGEPVSVSVSNDSDLVLYVTVIELDLLSFAIRQIHPPSKGAESRPLEPRRQERFQRLCGLPPGHEAWEGDVIFKAFGTLEPTSFRWLEMPPIDQPFRQSASHFLATWGWTVAQHKIRRTAP